MIDSSRICASYGNLSALNIDAGTRLSDISPVCGYTKTIFNVYFTVFKCHSGPVIICCDAYTIFDLYYRFFDGQLGSIFHAYYAVIIAAIRGGTDIQQFSAALAILNSHVT